MALRLTFLSVPLLIALVACGNEAPSEKAQSAPAEAPTGVVAERSAAAEVIVLRLTGTEDGMVSGQSGCRISYSVTNGSRKNIKFLSMEATPALNTDNPVVRSAVDARGKIAVYPGKLSKGESEDRSIGIAAARCDQLGGLVFSTLLCGFDDNLNCSGQVKFENQTGLTLEVE